MRVIPPLSLYAGGISMDKPWSITPEMLTSSSVAEPDLSGGAGEIAWVSGTTYAVADVRLSTVVNRLYKRKVAGGGTTRPEADATNWEDVGPTGKEVVWAPGAHIAGDIRIRTGTHRKFECIANVDAPGDTPPELDALHWAPIGASNRFSMFDVYRNISTTADGTLTVAIAPGQRVNSVGLAGVEASYVTVEMKIGAVVYFTRTASLIMRTTVRWSDYFFGRFRFNPNFLAFDLPLIAGATITLTYTGSKIKTGRVFIGRYVDCGDVLYEADNDGLNFSKIERDKFGNLELLAKRAINKTNQQLAVKKVQVNALIQLRTDLNAVPALWSGLDEKTADGYFAALFLVGIYRQFRIPLNHPDDTTYTLQLEES